MAQVDLWHVRTDALDAATCAACAALLTPEERAQHGRFVFEQNRLEYLVTRGLARAVLATYVAVRPSELAFVRTEHGRPLLDPSAFGASTSVRFNAPSGGRPPPPAPDLRFNLTNTVELVACGVALGAEIGIDAEPLARANKILEIAATVFTPYERAELDRLSDAPRRRRAVELWTLKEAYMKARGLGFSLPVKGFELVMGDRHAPVLRLHPEVQDDPARWTLAIHELEGHLVSTCVERASDGPTEVTLRRADLAALLSER
jgi:4'-phosphopantetheinyl transferase